MPITAAPPQPVQVFSGFDYVTVDETRQRAYAAHTASKRLLIVDASNGRVSAQVDVGPMHGVAVDPQTGYVYTGNGTDASVSKVDPVTGTVLASATVGGAVDAIAYDPARHRIYADQDNGPNVFVIDSATMRTIGTVRMPADDLESPAVDSKSGTLYQNLANGGGFAIVDPDSLHIRKIVRTSQLQDNHPLLFASGVDQVIVGGINGVLSAYTPDGTHIGDTAVQPHIDQCSTGSKGETVVCAGRGILTVLALHRDRPPTVVARVDTGHEGLHTAGIDESTGNVWVVYSDNGGDWVQRWQWSS
jgi:hypothetical protein